MLRLQQEEMNRKQAEIDAKEEEQRKQQQEIEDAKLAEWVVYISEAYEINAEMDRQTQIKEREAYAKHQAEIAAENARKQEVLRQQQEQERLRAEKEKLEANKAHVAKKCKQAKEFIMSFDVDEKTAIAIVKAIGNKKEQTLTLNL